MLLDNDDRIIKFSDFIRNVSAKNEIKWFQTTSSTGGYGNRAVGRSRRGAISLKSMTEDCSPADRAAEFE
jgi:hypothetical protein